MIFFMFCRKGGILNKGVFCEEKGFIGRKGDFMKERGILGGYMINTYNVSYEKENYTQIISFFSISRLISIYLINEK